MDILLLRIIECIPKKHGAKKELCDQLGLRANAVTEWESGRNKSYPKYAAAIADYYGVSLDWLSGRSDQKQKPAPVSGDEPAFNDFFALWKSLSPEEIARVKDFVQGMIANRKEQGAPRD